MMAGCLHIWQLVDWGQHPAPWSVYVCSVCRARLSARLRQVKGQNVYLPDVESDPAGAVTDEDRRRVAREFKRWAKYGR